MGDLGGEGPSLTTQWFTPNGLHPMVYTHCLQRRTVSNNPPAHTHPMVYTLVYTLLHSPHSLLHPPLAPSPSPPLPSSAPPLLLPHIAPLNSTPHHTTNYINYILNKQVCEGGGGEDKGEGPKVLWLPRPQTGVERVLGVVPDATAKDVHRGVQTGGGGRTLLYMIIKYDYLKTFIEECKQEEGDVEETLLHMIHIQRSFSGVMHMRKQFSSVRCVARRTGTLRE